MHTDTIMCILSQVNNVEPTFRIYAQDLCAVMRENKNHAIKDMRGYARAHFFGHVTCSLKM